MSTPLQKRANDLFVSYGHTDRTIVDPVVDWLRKSAGLKLWYDAGSGSAAQRTTDLLGRGIESARGALFFLSPNWSASTWCRDEHEVALTERRANDEFIIIAARIANVEIPTWFQTSQVLDLQKFDILSAGALLRSLTPNPPLRLDNDQDVYYAGPWSSPSPSVNRVYRIVPELGWRLVGDSQDHPKFVDSVQRITAIVQSSRGLVAILPFRPGNEPYHTSPWVLDEAQIAQTVNRPYILMAEQGVVVPPELAAHAFGARVLPLTADGPDEQIHSTLQAFDEMLSHVPHSNAGAYSFFAASLLGDATETDALVSVVERATNMTCVQGKDLTGQHAQEAIVDQIRDAAFVIADVTDDNRNALIESGVARGAGVPLHLTCRLPENGNRKTRFMLQDMEVNWYSNPLDRIGAMYRIARRYRRRILTPRIAP
jgi:TIR domain